MEKVIILKGTGGRGKTPTLNLLIELLIREKGAKPIYRDGTGTNIDEDCFVILYIPDFGKVGIITYGDKDCESSVKVATKECVNQECVALVGASHM